MNGRDRLLNLVCIVLSISVLYVVSSLMRKSMIEDDVPVLMVFILTPVIYAVYAVIGRKLLKKTTPLVWFTVTLILMIPLRDIYIQVSAGSMNTVMPYFLEHYINLFYLLSCILAIWLNCMSIFFIEWVMMSKGELVMRRTIFKRLAIVGTICLIAYPIVFTIAAFKINGVGTVISITYIYALWAGYKLLNAFGGISDQKFDELISSRTEGTKSIDTYRILSGDTAVIHGIRSALLWLGIGVILMSAMFLNTNLTE